MMTPIIDFLYKNSPVLLPIMFLASGMLLPLVAWKKDKYAWPFAMLVLSIAVSIATFNLYRVINSGPVHYRLGNWAPPIGIEYVLDHLSALVMLIIDGIALLVLIHSYKLIKHDLPGRATPYYGAMIMMLAGFNGIVVTGDLFNLYVFLEICSLALYGLIAAGGKKSPVAAFRYLIIGTLAATFYLLGVGYLYIVGGSLNMADVKAILPHLLGTPAAPTVVVAITLMIIGMAIKMALFPFHGWLPDAYTYAPSTSSALIAPTGTKVGAYVLLRIMFFVFGVNMVTKIFPIAQIIGWLAAIGIIYGSIMAIAQKELKRMLAYSSVAQVGYIGLGLGLANPLGFIGAVLHILNHAFMKGCLFLVSANMRYKLGHSDISRMDQSIRKKMPWTMAAFTVAALSMVGLPPMAGFFSKWYLVLGTIRNSNWVFLAVILASSLLNAVYFFRVLEKIYMKSPSHNPAHADRSDHLDHQTDHAHGVETESTDDTKRDEVGASMLIPTLIMGLGIIILGLLNAFIVKGIILSVMPAGM